MEVRGFAIWLDYKIPLGAEKDYRGSFLRWGMGGGVLFGQLLPLPPPNVQPKFKMYLN